VAARSGEWAQHFLNVSCLLKVDDITPLEVIHLNFAKMFGDIKLVAMGYHAASIA